jgi:hypothetical protein
MIYFQLIVTRQISTDIRQMIDHAYFESDVFEMSQLSRESIVHIRLYLVHPETDRSVSFPISGFPRPVIADELPACKLTNKRGHNVKTVGADQF